MSRFLFLLLVPVVVCAGCATESSEPEAPGPASAEPAAVTIPFRKDGTLTFLRGGEPQVTIAIEIAETDSARERGLMQRTALPEQSGMVLLFDEEGPQSIWMANTPLPLDLFFVNADSQIVKVAKYAQPFSARSIPSEAPTLLVVEVPAGFADQHGIVEGDRVRWRRDDSS